MNNQIRVTFNDNIEGTYQEGISLLELSKYYQEKMSNPILAAKINNIVFPLTERIRTNVKVEFIDFNDINGQAMYLATLKFILYVAIKDLFGKDSNIYYLNSLDKSLYCELDINESLTEEIIKKIKNAMKSIVDLDFPIEKMTVQKKEAVNYLNRSHEQEKAKNIQNLSNSTVVFYKLKQYLNYFYVDMPYSTKVCNKFDIEMIDDKHLVLKYPTARSNNNVPTYTHFNNTLGAFDRYREWLNVVNVKYVSDINDVVSSGKILQFMQMNKIMLDLQLAKISKDINERKDKIKMVLLAGPSSSGKTTSALRVSLYLKTMGFNPVILSVDNYYKERVDNPKDENGNYDYETIEALDLKLFNEDLTKLIAGEEISVPKYNFYSGKKEWNGNLLKLKNNDIIICEGLHCLNPAFSSSVPDEDKYKIYVSPFMALRIDRHNHISTVDIRLIRRIVRDSVYRGKSVSDTIKSWQSVRKGEEQNIFPYQEEADMMLNTASAFEIGVLKVYAEPLLYSVPVNSPYYEEARRLLGCLRIYFPITSEYLATDSVLREFIGGSIFDPN